ncbi:hypothetical protein ACIQF6_00225 [Kitasatospora sp. NPDC092948]|uniref:hypothetical protein n=1 Tax=Kitasatospora sp. NPDC092948 TaxID=3364088 RepID=UPI0037FEA603
MTHRTWHRTARSTRLRGVVLALAVAAALAGPAAVVEAVAGRSPQAVGTAAVAGGYNEPHELVWNSTTSDCFVPPGRTGCL